MAGILDLFGDPATQGVLNLAGGMLQASGPSRMPVSMGQVFGQGLQQGTSAYQSAQKAKQIQALTELEQQKLLQAKAQFDLQQGLLRQFGMGAPAPAGAPAAGPTPPGMSPTTSTALFGAPDFATQPPAAPTSPSPSAFPFTVPQMAALKIAGMPDLLAYYKETRPDLKFNDVGNEVIVYDKGQVVQRIPKGAAPGAVPYEASDVKPGEYRDFLISKGRAGASNVINNVNAFTPASEAAQTQFMQSTRQNYEKLRDAPVLITNLQEARKIAASGNPFIGSLGDKKVAIAQFFNNNLGTNIAPDELADAGALRTRLFQQVKDQLKKMDATPSQMQQQRMEDAFGSLNTDPKALEKIIDITEEVVRGQVDVHNKEVDSALKRRVQFPYDPLIKLPEAMRIDAPGKPMPTNGPKKGEVVDGWEFMGGDPANRMSWRKK